MDLIGKYEERSFPMTRRARKPEELGGTDQSGCLWRKPKTFEDIVRERELSVKSEFSI